MKNVHVLVFFLLGGFATASLAEEISLGKFTLAAGGKRSVGVESKTPVKVGFDNDSTPEQIRNCKHRCIRMSVVGDPFSAVAASVGTVIYVQPVDGKAEVVFENLEAFPITISVFRR